MNPDGVLFVLAFCSLVYFVITFVQIFVVWDTPEEWHQRKEQQQRREEWQRRAKREDD